MQDYHFELFLIVVWSNAKEAEQRLKVLKSVHHRRSSQAPSMGGIECTACLCRLRERILDVLSLVNDDSVPFASGKEENCLVPSPSDDASILALLLKLLRFQQDLVVGCESTKRGDHDIVIFQHPPWSISLLVMEDKGRELMPPWLDVTLNLKPPLIHQSFGTDD